MSIPENLVDHVKHVFVPGTQRDCLLRIAAEVEALKAKCGTTCAATPTPVETEEATPAPRRRRGFGSSETE